MHIIPLAAEEIERKILNIPDHWGEVADQFYNPESIHAQSGLAVAEALTNVLQFIEQELDADQQARARLNIGAAEAEVVAQLSTNKLDRTELTAHDSSVLAHADLRALVAELQAGLEQLPTTNQIHRETNELLSDIVKNYILNINYDKTLKFDTEELVIGGGITAASPILGTGKLGYLVLA